MKLKRRSLSVSKDVSTSGQQSWEDQKSSQESEKST